MYYVDTLKKEFSFTIIELTHTFQCLLGQRNGTKDQMYVLNEKWSKTEMKSKVSNEVA